MAKNIALKLARAKLDLTQLDLAEKVGLKEHQITLIETGRGRTILSYGLACRIAEILEEKIEVLFPEFKKS